MKLTTFFLSIAFAIVCTSCKEKVSCKEFRSGRFKIKSINSVAGFDILRKDSVQFETNDRSGIIRRYAVEWISDCEYKLSLINEVRDTTVARFFISDLFDSLNRVPTTTRIVATAKDYYVLETRKQGMELVYSDTAWVLK